MTAYHLRGIALPQDEAVELWIADGVISTEPIHGAETLCREGWIIPGLVDAHSHVGLGPKGPVELAEALTQAEIERDAGALLLRDAGSPVDTRDFDQREDLPRIIRAGRHLARPKRYIPMLGLELEDESLLPNAVAEQAAFGDGWVKLVGDWIDRGTGDLSPLWSDAILNEAIAVAHAAGARVTAHVFGEEALPGLINADIDCLEHGTGLTEDVIAQMLTHGTELVPTLINIENFPSFADAASRFPAYAKHIRGLHERHIDTFSAAVEAGVPLHAGTDAGGFVEHGRIADELIALTGIGLSTRAALRAASHDARNWLRVPAGTVGDQADLVVYPADPADEPSALHHPLAVFRAGHRFGPR